MKTFMWTLLIGIVAGGIDIVPMIKQKLDSCSILSAFAHYVIATWIIFHVDLHLPWWIEGGCLTLLLAIPVIILVGKEDKKSRIPMVISSLILGSFIGICEHGLIPYL